MFTYDMTYVQSVDILNMHFTLSCKIKNVFAFCMKLCNVPLQGILSFVLKVCIDAHEDMLLCFSSLCNMKYISYCLVNKSMTFGLFMWLVQKKKKKIKNYTYYEKHD